MANNITVEQVAQFVRQVVKQGMGETALATLDAQGIVAVGQEVINSQQNTEAFLNTMVQMIGMSIYSSRAYRNKYRTTVLGQFDYGAIVQKITAFMPDIIADESWALEDGTSVDDMKVYKPNVDQKFFFSRSPFAVPLTTKLDVLEEAFNSYQQMGSFIASLRQSVLNKIELAMENLGRFANANFMAEASSVPGRIINLVGDYNQIKGTALTAQTALFDADFLRYASTIIRYTSDLFTEFTYAYGDGTIPRFTPKEMQRIRLWSRFNRALESEVLYDAFHEDFLRLDNFEAVNFWQNYKSPTAISIKRASDDTLVQIDNIVGIIHDRDALGIFQQHRRVLSTPVNALGAYYNTFWHLKQLWFNDASENGVVFTLNADPSPASDFTEELKTVSAREFNQNNLNAVGGFVPNAPRAKAEPSKDLIKSDKKQPLVDGPDIATPNQNNY